MVTPEILTYIKDHLTKGTSVDEIKKTLSTSGWSEADISAAVSSAQSGVPIPSPTPTSSDDHRTLITILLLLFISPVGLIVMWFWSKWKTWVKIIVTLLLVLPLIFLFIVFLMTMGAVYSNPNKFMDSYTSGTSIKTSFRDSFINSCVDSAENSGMTASDCNCVADYLITNFDSSKLANISSQVLSSGEAPSELVDAITSCLSPSPSPSPE